VTVHFTGDSVTDCGRQTLEGAPLGDGYVALLAQRAELTSASVHNSGVSGDRVRELSARWRQDVLSTRPDVLSILVGINDTWRRYDSNDPTSTEQFHGIYEWLLSSAREYGVRHIVLCEPFLLPIDAGQQQWRTDLDPKIDAVHDLARRFDAILVATDAELTALAQRLGTQTLAADGVHPTTVGHEAIARMWWTAAGALF
jgi:lysophospholipase L1-like esterase